MDNSFTLLYTRVTDIVFTLICSGSPPISSMRTRVFSLGFRKYCGTWYKDWDGCPLGVLKEAQYRPMLSPLIHTSPFPILLRFSVTGSFPHGVSNVVLYQISGRCMDLLMAVHCARDDPSGVYILFISPDKPIWIYLVFPQLIIQRM